MFESFARRAVVAGAAFAAVFSLAACGPGDKTAGEKAKANAATPAADPARASKINGVGPDGQPIDAVAAAEMNEADLPPLPNEAYSDVYQPAPMPESAKKLAAEKPPAG